jgi:hypothetical protein
MKKIRLILIAMMLLSPPVVYAEVGNEGGGDYRRQPITQMMDFPGVPRYTGPASFFTGVAYPNAPGGASYTVILNASHDPSIITQWYQTALPRAQWTLLSSSCLNMVRAERDGSFFEVRATPGNGCGSRVTMQYRMVKQ